MSKQHTDTQRDTCSTFILKKCVLLCLLVVDKNSVRYYDLTVFTSLDDLDSVPVLFIPEPSCSQRHVRNTSLFFSHSLNLSPSPSLSLSLSVCLSPFVRCSLSLSL